MSTSPLSPEDIRAAAEVCHELGPEYNDAVVASFIDRVDREVAARVNARLADTRPARPAVVGTRRTLLKGMVVGAVAGGLTIAAVGGLAGRSGHSVRVFPRQQHVMGAPRAVHQPPAAPAPPPSP
jgi:hypothetical protein